MKLKSNYMKKTVITSAEQNINYKNVPKWTYIAMSEVSMTSL